MNLELSQISEVPQALEILRGEVGRVETAVREEGAKVQTYKYDSRRVRCRISAIAVGRVRKGCCLGT